MRIDLVLVERGLARSRNHASTLVESNRVLINGKAARKSSQNVEENDKIAVLESIDYVSRAGHKLAKALDVFTEIDLVGKTALDVGASTGGFTDVLLTRGAARVYAVDVGTNQLAWRLREDARVTVLEQTSARILTPELIDRPCNWVVCDASFISLAKVLERPLELAATPCQLVALIKPQFEVGREEVGKGGVVRDPALHRRVCDEVRLWLEGSGWTVDGIVPSPITGPEGNVEFLVVARRGNVASASALGHNPADESP